MNLRPYQTTAVESTEAGWLECSRQLGVLPTGSGKTIVFSHLAHRRLEKSRQRTLILAHREELIDQAIEKLHRATGVIAAKEKASERASRLAGVVVGSVQSLQGARLESWPRDHFGLVVVDEAHHTLATTYRNILAHFDGHAHVLGVTATSDRGDKRNLGEYFQRISFEVSLFDLIGQGFLAPITIKSVPLSIDLSAVKSTAGDFNDADLGDALEPYLPQIAGAIAEHGRGRRVLVFVPLIATSHKFVAACQDVGLDAHHIDGTSPDRSEILQRFAKWDFSVLSNAMLLTEGFDDPGIDCVVVLRPTRSRPLYAQMVGRGTRVHDFKENLLLLDFLWLHKSHRIVRPAHLIAKSDEEAEQITKIAQEGAEAGWGQEDLELGKLAGLATAEREKALAKKLRENKGRKGETISAEEFAANHDAFAVAEYEPVMAWQREPVTERQANVLRHARIDLDTVKGKDHASQLIDLVFRDRKLSFASENAAALMRKMSGLCHSIGIHDLSRPTNAEAGRFFAELRKRKQQPTFV